MKRIDAKFYDEDVEFRGIGVQVLKTIRESRHYILGYRQQLRIHEWATSADRSKMRDDSEGRVFSDAFSMKFPGKRTNIELEEVLYLTE